MIKKLHLLHLLLCFLALDSFARSPHKTFHTTSKFIEIPLNISVKDKKMGVQLKPKVTLVPIAGGKPIEMKETEGQMVVMVTWGEVYKITVEQEGYKTIEKEIDTKIYDNKDGGNVVLDMEPLPSATVIFKAVDENGEPVEAIFKVTLNDKIYSGRTTRTNPTYKAVLTKSDLYQIEVLASTFQAKKENYYFEVGDPSRQYPKTYSLQKPGSKLQIVVIGFDTEKAIKGAKVNIKSGEETLLDKELAEGTASIESVFGKSYSITAEYRGYVKHSSTFKGTLDKDLKIMLQPETMVSVGAFDKATNKRILANFTITDSNGKTQEYEGKPDADTKFQPSGKGTYKIDISAKNYKSQSENLVIENLSAGNLNFSYKLESLVEDFIVLVRDADDKQLIAKPNVKVFDDAGKEIELKINQKTGEILVQLEKQRDYKVSVEAPEYQTKNETIQRTSKLIAVNLKKTSQLYLLSAIDAMTKQPVLVQYKLTRPDNQEPLNGTSDANRQFRVEALPQKTYILEIAAEGYKPVSQNIYYDASKTDKEIPRIFELEKNAYAFNFKVIDATTKKEVSGSKLKVLNLSSSQPVSLTESKNGFSGNLIYGSNYSFEAEADGYVKTSITANSKDIAVNGFDYQISVSKNPFEKYKLLVVEDGSNNKVLNANLRVFDTKNEPIQISSSATSNEWQAELKNDENYSVEIKADGYVAYRNSLSKNPNDKSITIKIQKVPKHDVTFAVVDAFSKKGIVSEFKVLANGTAVSGSVLAGGVRYKTTLSEDKNFEIEVNSKEYPAYKDAIRLGEVVNGVKTIELKKETYAFNFKIVDTKSKKPVSNPKMVITESNSTETVAAKFSLENNEFQASLKPDKTYTLAVESVGFENFTEIINSTELISKENTNRVISLSAIKKEEKPKEIEKPKVEPPKVEPPKERPIEVSVTNNPKKEEPKKEEPKAEVVKKEPPKPAPKKEPEKKPALYEAPMEITDDDFAVKVDVFEKKVVGRRFRLSNLYFEQSSPIIQPKSYAQLDKFANTLKLNPKLIIEITGHTDNVGLATQNLYLSEQRARVVANYLFNKGIANERIRYSGKGQEEPIAINDTDENKAKNRRVEFILRDDVQEKKQ